MEYFSLDIASCLVEIICPEYPDGSMVALLRSLCLVSSTFRELCQRKLFSHLDVNRKPTVEGTNNTCTLLPGTKLLSLLDQNKRIATYVRSLKISNDSDSVPWLSIDEHLPVALYRIVEYQRIQKLSLCKISAECAGLSIRHTVASLCGCPSLRFLKFRSCPLSLIENFAESLTHLDADPSEVLFENPVPPTFDIDAPKTTARTGRAKITHLKIEQ
ncbi:hypothetical protein FA15DRAFT_703741 [Coprinopsis marcescibilis]|uniref:F-box domain-containing protein n=1 Tax=Coprinopsis marcescibilis TaxID=230819 RepID=A0A5C3KXE2_COPMA|nr:hypothetical protein FA15DRAFT_703741 [Coprinopsis marcescibilis]